MRSVNVAELQNDLSAYLTCAQAGEEVIIHDHDRPVLKLALVPAEEPESEPSPEIAAMLTPFDPEKHATKREREMAAAGILRLPKYKLDMETFLKLPRAKTRDGASAVQAMLDERAESW